MDRKEAEKIIRILITADGGCEYCVSELLGLFCKEFPEFREIAEKVFKETFDKNLNNFIKNNTPLQKKKYRLHGWDDEKIYFWDDEKKKERCVSEEKELYNKLLRVCVKYFERKKK